jgi:hypothetical protein
MAKMSNSLPFPTNWLDPKEIPPPENVQLLIQCRPLSELDVEFEAFACTGYWSPKTKTYISDESMRCLSEMFEIELYHVITNSQGNTISVFISQA